MSNNICQYRGCLDNYTDTKTSGQRDLSLLGQSGSREVGQDVPPNFLIGFLATSKAGSMIVQEAGSMLSHGNGIVLAKVS